MTCLTIEEVVKLLLEDPAGGPADRVVVSEHLCHCPTCAAQVAEVRATFNRLQVAHDQFDVGHAAQRQQLMVLVRATQPQTVRRNRWFIAPEEMLIGRRTWLSAAAAAAILLAMFIGWNAMQPLSALAQAAKVLQEARSFRCKVTTTSPPGADGKTRIPEVGVLCWETPGSVRFETLQDNIPSEVRIMPHGKTGVEVNHKDESFRRLEPTYIRGFSPARLVNGLAEFRGRADKDLGMADIDGMKAVGFEVAFSKIDSDFSDGIVRVWIDPASKRLILLEMDHTTDGKWVTRFDHFEWDVAMDGWFDTTPPTMYVDKTPMPPTDDEVTNHVVLSLKTFAKYGGGKYPQVQNVYGHNSSDEMFRNAGLTVPSQGAGSVEERSRAEYFECFEALKGFAWMNHLQRHNADATYYGKTVGADDKNKVLFRWKLVSGEHRVIYGDLRADTLNSEQLKRLEAK